MAQSKRALLKSTPYLIIGTLVGAVLMFSLLSNSGPDNTEIGRSLYVESCQSCHGNAGTGAGSLPGVPVHGPTGHTWHHADGQIVAIVLGALEYSGRTMPSFMGVIDEDEVRQILDYLKTNWSSQQRSAQAEVSRNWEELYGGS